MATRKDVAMRAGVSVATVSNVINRSKNVTPAVERRVRDAIEALNYRPNLLARGLSTRESKHMAMLVDNLYNPHYAELLAGAQAEASEQGYIVSVLSVDLSNPQDILDLPSRGVDGAILALSCDCDRVEAMIGELLPCVRLGGWVRVDYGPAAQDMIKLLKALGHRDMAFLSGVDLRVNPAYPAWRQAMETQGLPIREELIVDGVPPADQAEGYRAMEALLARNVPFTALFAGNDLAAMGAMRALHRAGRSVPGDVSVVGCDQLQAYRCVTPTLASMDTHAFEIGRCLVRLLTEEIALKPHETLIVPARFAPGESVGPAPTDPKEQAL